jgi:hypothetical protein
MKPKDYISKKAAEEALKAFGATQLNSNQETSPFFLGRINASRTHITDPTGRQYKLIFTGNPKEYELAQRLSDDTAVVNATAHKSINVDGNKKTPILILRERNLPVSNNYVLQIGNKSASLDTLAELVEVNPGNGQLIIIPKLSLNCRDLLIFKLQLNHTTDTSLAATIESSDFLNTFDSLSTPCGTSGGCTLVDVGRPTSNSEFYTSTSSDTYIYSASVFKQININDEGEFTYSRVDNLATNVPAFATDQIVLDPNTYGSLVPAGEIILNYSSITTARQVGFGGNLIELLFDSTSDGYTLLMHISLLTVGPYFGWAEAFLYWEQIPADIYCGRLITGGWVGCDDPFPRESFLRFIFSGEYGTRTNLTAIISLFGEFDSNILYGGIEGVRNDGTVVNTGYPTGDSEEYFGVAIPDYPTSFRYRQPFLDRDTYLFPTFRVKTTTSGITDALYKWSVGPETISFNNSVPSDEIEIPLSPDNFDRDSKAYVVSPYGNFSYNDFNTENLGSVVPYRGSGFIGMQVTSFDTETTEFNLYTYRLDKEKGEISNGISEASGSFNSALYGTYQIGLRS